MSNKKKEHTKYHTKDGVEVPSCTTVLKIVDTDFLPQWANSLGFKRKSYSEELNMYSRIGTFAHALMENHIIGECPELNEKRQECGTEEQIQAYKAFNNYLRFVNEHDFNPVHSELQLVSEKYKFGGTIDCICELDGAFCILDFKTSNYFGKKMLLQLAGYVQLYKEYMEETGQTDEIEEVAVLKLSKTEDKYELLRVPMSELEPYFLQFKYCLAYFRNNKALEEDFKDILKHNVEVSEVYYENSNIE